MIGSPWMFWVIALLCFGFQMTYGQEETNDVCGNTTIIGPTGQISMANLTKGTKCTYKIIAKAYAPQVALKFDKIMLDANVFNLTVYANSTEGPVIANLTQVGQDKPYSLVVSRYNVTVLVFSRTDVDTNVTSSGFSASFDTKKCQVLDSSVGGVIISPLYLPENGSVKCVYNATIIVNGYKTVLSFLNFNVMNGFVNVTMGDSITSLSGNKTPDDSFAPVGVTSIVLNVMFNKDTTPQDFTALYQTVDPICSGTFKATDVSTALSVPKSNQLPVKCYMQIVAKGKHVYVTGAEISSLTSQVDSFVFYDGKSTQGLILGTLAAGQNWFVSRETSMTVVASLGAQTNRTSSLMVKADKFSMFYVLKKSPIIVTFDGNFVEKDIVMLQFDSKDPTRPKVKIELISNSTITDAVVIVLCNHGETVYNFTGKSLLFPVVLPSSRALVKIINLGKGQKVTLQASAVPDSDCNQILAGKSGQILLTAVNATSCNLVVNSADDVILDLSAVNLCKTGKLEIYQGTLKTSQKVATLTAGNTYPVIPQMKFPLGSGPRLVWTDSNNTCTEPSVVGRYWTQNNAATCGSLSSGLNGTISTPNYPNQYPLNVMCNWTLPSTVNASMMFLSVNTMQFNLQQNMTLKNTSTNKVLATFSGTTLPNDLLITNRNLSIVFSSQQAVDGMKLTQAAQGAQISYKVLTCGGLVKDVKAKFPVHQLKNQSIECVWIIQVQEKGTKLSVNIVSANFTVIGYKDASNGTLEVHDGGSIRDPQMSVNLTSKNATNLKSRRNIMLVRYTYTSATSGPFGVNISYVTFNCNSTMQCDNGICLQPQWLCDGIPQCADGKDEKHCNGSQPIPPGPVPPSPQTGSKKGVSGFWLAITLLIGVVVGIVLTVTVPKCIRKVRQRNIARMSNYDSLHEDT